MEEEGSPVRLGSRPLLSRSSVPRLSPQKQGSAHVTGRAGKCIDLKPTSAEAGASGHLWDQEGSGLRPARPGQGGEAGKGDGEKAREPNRKHAAEDGAGYRLLRWGGAPTRA